MTVESECSNRLPSLKFVGVQQSALIGLVTSTFEFLTSNLVHVIAREVMATLFTILMF